MGFRIAYEVRDARNQVDPEAVYVGSLDGAVQSYRPDADLRVHVDGSSTELDVSRDMYGLHEDLLSLADRMTFDRESFGPYLATVPAASPKRYSIRLDESYRPRLVFFAVDEDRVGIETRTLHGSDVVRSDDDVHPAVPSTRSAVVGEIVRFLDRYLEDLAVQLPEVTETPEYAPYRSKLEAVRAALGGQA